MSLIGIIFVLLGLVILLGATVFFSMQLGAGFYLLAGSLNEKLARRSLDDFGRVILLGGILCIVFLLFLKLLSVLL